MNQRQAGLLVALAFAIVVLIEFRTVVTHLGVDLAFWESVAVGLVVLALGAALVLLGPRIRGRLSTKATR